MGGVVGIHRRQFFTLEEARDVLPIIRRLTKTAENEVNNLSARLSFIVERDRRMEIEDEIQRSFQHWCDKLQKLGCEAKGMWLVDFDHGEGYYCWHHPEPALSFRHGYLEGFRSRVKIV